MARIAGVNIPREKPILLALTYIYGIGRKSSADICATAGVDPTIRVHKLAEGEVVALREVIDKSHKVEGERRAEYGINIKRLMDLGCYRGLRHRKSLPVRGQRTHTNARTRKGKSRAIAGKKIAAR